MRNRDLSLAFKYIFSIMRLEFEKDLSSLIHLKNMDNRCKKFISFFLFMSRSTMIKIHTPFFGSIKKSPKLQERRDYNHYLLSSKTPSSLT